MRIHTRSARRFWVTCLLFAVCGLFLPTAWADGPLYCLPTSRFGVDLNPEYGLITDYNVGALHIGWYADWSTNERPLRPGGIEYAQLIVVHEGHWGVSGAGDPWSVLERMLAANPGALWMIGNEPECPYPPGGGNNTPEQYAAVYHDLYEYIKLHDATARVAIGGVVEPTPLRKKWLQQVLGYYETTYHVRMPVDVWTTHVLILQEKRDDWGCGIPAGLSENEGRLYTVVDSWSIPVFKQMVRDFRTWMDEWGYRDRPLVIAEYGVLMPYAGTEDVNAFMTASFDFLLYTSDSNVGYPADANLLVQRWAWNSLNDSPGNFNGGLFHSWDRTYPGTLTAFGQNFTTYTNSLLAGPACIHGTVHLERRPAAPDDSYATAAMVALLRTDCPQPEPDLRSVTTNRFGVFTLCNVPAGTYDIVVKGYNTLANRTNTVVLAAGSTSVDLGPLHSGDANNDNQVTILDFSLLAASYGAKAGDSTYDDRADFNGDGKLDILDFSLLATNYSRVGAQIQ